MGFPVVLQFLFALVTVILSSFFCYRYAYFPSVNVYLKNNFPDTIIKLDDIAVKYLGYSGTCWYRKDITAALRERLPFFIRGQNKGLKIIIDAFASWEMQRNQVEEGLGIYEGGPLVLAITGPTGVGKTEVAFRIGQALFSSNEEHPPGFLLIKGSDYASIDHFSELSGSGARSQSYRDHILKLQNKFRDEIYAHVRKCSNFAVIAIDEVQKFEPGVLEVIMSALEERGTISPSLALWSSWAPWSSLYPPISTANCAFLFLSDIGGDDIVRELIRYEHREAVPISIIRTQVKKALDEQWSRLKLGKTISEVVPFLPLEREHIEEVMELKLLSLNASFASKYWLELVVDRPTLQYFSQSKFVEYQAHSIQVWDTITNTTRLLTKSFATYGARALENGGPLRDLRSLFYKKMTMKPEHYLFISSKKRSHSIFSKDEYELLMQWCESNEDTKAYFKYLKDSYPIFASQFLDETDADTDRDNDRETDMDMDQDMKDSDNTSTRRNNDDKSSEDSSSISTCSHTKDCQQKAYQDQKEWNSVKKYCKVKYEGRLHASG